MVRTYSSPYHLGKTEKHRERLRDEMGGAALRGGTLEG